MKINFFLQVIILLTISISTVSVILISEQFSSYNEKIELDKRVDSIKYSYVDDVNNEIIDIEIELKTVLNYLKDDKQNNFFDDSLFAFLAEDEIDNLFIFVDGEMVKILTPYVPNEIRTIDFTKVMQVLNEDYLAISQSAFVNGKEITAVAIIKQNLFSKSTSYNNYDLHTTLIIGGEVLGNTPKEFVQKIIFYSNLDYDYSEEFSYVLFVSEESNIYSPKNISIVAALSIPLAFSPLIVNLTARKFSNNIEKLLAVSSNKEKNVSFSFEELSSVSNSISKDRNELENLNKMLNGQIKALREAHADKELFNSAISHSMKTSLVTIRGYSEMLMDKDKDPHVQKLLQYIIDSSDQLKLQINNILEAFKIETLKTENVLLKDIDVSEIKKLVKLSFSQMFEINNRDFKILTSLEKESSKINVSMLVQILGNLFTNAIEFTKNGGSIIMEITKDNSKIYFNIIDDGKGIKPKLQQDLFDKFSKSSDTLNRFFGGAGLGLYISRKLARSMNGDLYLKKSVLGEGSQFTLEFPLSKPDYL